MLISCTEDDSRKQGWEKPPYRLLWNFWNDDEFVLNLIYCTFSSGLTSLDVYVKWKQFISPILDICQTNSEPDLILNKLLN